MTGALAWLASVILGSAATALLVPAVVLAAQVLASRRRDSPSAADPLGPADEVRIGVLMPAHNEAAGIVTAIESVRRQLGLADRLLVVADNCDDDTAAVAAAAGADVVERHDASRRGKGYALDHGMRHYAAAPVDVVVILDADCELHPGALQRLATQAIATGRPVQALYLMTAPPGAGVKTRVAEFAWRVRNLVRPQGGLALGWPCQLMGTGMAFPWAVLPPGSLASGHLVEDMELGLALAERGTPPLFCPGALVTSVFARDGEGSRSQRTRWEHGHLAMITTRGLPLLLRSLRSGRPSLAAMALDLCVPPLASLVVVQGTLTLVSAGWAAGTGRALPLVLALAGSVCTTAAVVMAWRRHGRDLIGREEVRALPAYVLGKLPMYLRWFTRRQTEWVRTKRDGAPK